jgi:hypothetical protein
MGYSPNLRIGYGSRLLFAYSKMAKLESADSILSDPTGKLAELHDAVACHYRAPHWIVARCERAKQDVLEQWLPWMIQSESLYENAFGFGMTVMEIALIPVLADLRPPTVRKALVIAQQVLRKHEQLSLYEDLLSLVGSATWTQADILAVLHDYEIAFDKATQVFHTPFWGRFGIGAAARPIFIEGTRELIDLGYGREAAVFVLGGHTVSQMVLENDALEEEKPYYRNLYRCFLARLGIHSSQDIHDRAEPARHLLQRSMQVANIIGTCHAGIRQ